MLRKSLTGCQALPEDILSDDAVNDSVIGKNILPTFDDLPKLKYVNAIRKECLRYVEQHGLTTEGS